MINRELIRIKTVQLLYSYLLVENPFSLESSPSAPTKEKRFAYSLYLDLLYLMTRVARVVDSSKGSPLYDTRFVRNILADEKIHSLANRSELERNTAFSSIERELADEIKKSAIYKRFLQSVSDGTPDENVWKDIFEYLIVNNPRLLAELTTRENYSLKGVDRMRAMMDTTFSNFFASADNLPDALKILRFSLDRTREFYLRLMALPIAITEMRRREIDNAQYKLLKTQEDINPNLRFVENQYVEFLERDESLQKAFSQYHIGWIAEDENLVKNLLHTIMKCNLYEEYLEFPATDFRMDCEFWRNLYKFVIFMDQDFLESLEDKSVFWNDDLDVIGTFILKSIKRLSSDGPEYESVLLPMYKDDEDARFGAELFSYVIRKKDYYRQLIIDNVDDSQWDMERLAFMDVVIMMTALAEIMNFPKVPLSVSFNEYIEIAKYYSTPRSGTFINGFLSKIVNKLQREGKILKTFN